MMFVLLTAITSSGKPLRPTAPGLADDVERWSVKALVEKIMAYPESLTILDTVGLAYWHNILVLRAMSAEAEILRLKTIMDSAK